MTDEDSEWEDSSEDEEARNIITVMSFFMKNTYVIIYKILFNRPSFLYSFIYKFHLYLVLRYFLRKTLPTANRVVSDSEWIESDEDQASFDNNDRIDLRLNYGLIPWEQS